MPKFCYIPTRIKPATRGIINKANRILDEYAAQGFTLTLRQLYYKFIARDLLPPSWIDKVYNKKHGLDPQTKNTVKNYKRLGETIGMARLAGLIDWEYIEDRTRNLSMLQQFESGQEALNKMAEWYHTDLWKDQRYRPEVWIEKEALAGVIQGPCQENDIPFFSCKGYTSLSEMWRASNRLREWMRGGQEPYIIHFGDHDPSGMDMSRDIFDRLNKVFLAETDFHRVALNMSQIEKYAPPPNPAKVTDSRYKTYVAKYGDESWELDALEPVVFRQLIEGQVKKIRDDKLWDRAVAEKIEVRERLRKTAREWEKKPKRKPRKTKRSQRKRS